MNRLSFVAAGIVLLAASTPVSAAVLFWSGDGSSQGGNGTWNTTLARFGTVGGGPYTTVWNNTTNAADSVTFGGSTATATLGVAITVRQLTFNNASTVAGGGFSLTTGGTIALTAAAGGSARSTGGTISAPLVGSGGLAISGVAGPIALTGSSTYSGTTTIATAISGSASRLNLGSGGTAGSIGSSSGINVGGGSIFSTNRSDTVTQGVNFPLIAGSGNFIKAGSGATIFSLENAYSGTTTVSSGTLQMGDGGTAGSLGSSSSISVSSGATFAVNRSNNANQASSGGGFRALSGAGGFRQAGSGTTTLTLTNSYTGPTSVVAGSLLVTGTLGATDVSISAGAALGGNGLIGGNVSFGANSAFVFNAAAPLTVSGSVSFTNPADFGVADILGLDSSVAEGTYTLIAGNVDTTGLANLGAGNAYSLGSGKAAYLQSGSLQLIVVPEPSLSIAALLGAAVCVARLVRRVA